MTSSIHLLRHAIALILFITIIVACIAFFDGWSRCHARRGHYVRTTSGLECRP